MTTIEHTVYNLMLEGPPANPIGVSFTGLPNTCKGTFPRSQIKTISRYPTLRVTVEVTQADTRFYGFGSFAGKTIVLVPKY